MLRLLGLATLLNGAGYIPYVLIQAIGRPEVVTVFHLLELPVYATLAWALILAAGVEGAALAWLIRMGVAIPLFTAICLRIAGLSVVQFAEAVARTAAVLLSVGGGAVLVGRLLIGSTSGAWWTGLAATSAVSAVLLWRFGLTEEDRAAFAAVVGKSGFRRGG